MENNAQLINQSSGNVEYYTPSFIIEAARMLMGSIDLDPASCEIANRTVKATHIFTQEMKNPGSLETAWLGNIWLNHPFGKKESACTNPGPNCPRLVTNKRHKCHIHDHYGNDAWIKKLVSEVQRGSVHQACCITYAVTSEAWFQPLLVRPQCFLTPRTNYFGPDGNPVTGVTKGSVVTYFGPRIVWDAFACEFARYGVVKFPAIEPK